MTPTPGPVRFDRMVIPRFAASVDELRTWTMDIRQVLGSNAIKDALWRRRPRFTRIRTPGMDADRGRHSPLPGL